MSNLSEVKVEHRHLMGELIPLQIPNWKWDLISMDFVMSLPISAIKKNAI